MPPDHARGFDAANDAASATSAAAAVHAEAEPGRTPLRDAGKDAAVGDASAAAEHADPQCGDGGKAQRVPPIQLSVAAGPVAYAISVASGFSSPERQPLSSSLAELEAGGAASSAHASPAASPEGRGGAVASIPKRKLPAYSLGAPKANEDASPAQDAPAARMHSAAPHGGPEGDAGAWPVVRRSPSPAGRRASWLAARAGGLRVDPATLPAAGLPTGSGRRPGSASPGLRSGTSSGSKGQTPSASLGSTPTSAAARRPGASPSEGPAQGLWLNVVTPMRMGAPRGGSAGRPPVSPAPAAPPEQGPAWLTALLAEAAKAAAGPAEAESTKPAGPEPGRDASMSYARPERRRWELPDAGAISSAPAVRENAGRRLEEAGAAQERSRGAGTGQAPVGADGDASVHGRSEEGGWAPMAEVIDVCVMAGVRAQYACSSCACLGCAPCTWGSARRQGCSLRLVPIARSFAVSASMDHRMILTNAASGHQLCVHCAKPKNAGSVNKQGTTVSEKN